MDSIFSYHFPALRGVQAEKEYYVVMCPLHLIPKIFLFDEEEVQPEYRAQRIINRARIPEMTNYIIENRKDYVFSSLTVSVDGDMQFVPFSKEQQFEDLGKLVISLEAKFLINDGQHRRAAIEEALKISPELGQETISVVFYHDKGLRKSQQIFADLNRHAVNTTSSLGILYDHRDQLANLTKEIISEVPLLERYTDKERVSLSKLSPKIFALNHIFNANCRILNKKKGEFISEQEKVFLKEFWKVLTNSITEWQQVMKKELTPSALRINYIVAHGIFLEAVGLIAHYLYINHPMDWKSYIGKLSSIDWNRSNKADWMGRAYGSTGRINKNNQTVQLTANLIKQKIGLPLVEHEQKLEGNFKLGERVSS
ncbi:DNA sulfur modification protein DndB [Aneurinibacillus migulanus]|uniref:DNA sulfur modification protein DndB n=1 Tax=Aneurinibacillus migulanus TaxID=47500 RepID=UPI0005BAA276|nr:DNA sulfur modification protein DndB [Aneurinibacillus migulanus]KIV56065.1 DNA sulfur modification protein DndB [Aneurinibacillus migulanus]KPD06589.1 DNA sulfur modification protein DndB [Aneurinibacillus migulanus]CEH29394.1 DNA sulfur modification protein DndB [Aneurinibacillus migulanus]